MIKYNLICKNCKNSFNSWFSSSAEFEKLKKNKHLNCYKCNSINIEKSLMSPNILSSKNTDAQMMLSKEESKIRKKIREYKKFIKKNFNYVGENFAQEVRSIKYNKKEKTKGIYGKASFDEISELKEEGIDTDIIPWFDNSDN
jgi:hypothetical protein